MSRSIHDLGTPALLLDVDALDHNLDVFSKALPGPRLRPHVKAHKCTALARRQAERGHRGFTCATVREMVGLAEAGLGDDLLLANEVVDPVRLAQLVALDARVTVAVDSEATIRAAARAGIAEVLIDVNVGLPRCGCSVEDAGALAELARREGVSVRGVMGYEGHVVGNEDREAREAGCAESMQRLLQAHEQVGGDVISAGGTGTYDCNRWATEIQAGSYALMDTAYGKLGFPLRQALFLWCTVISVSENYAVADGGLKSLGMDHGNPSLPDAKLWFCSDEHVTFAPAEGAPVKVGDKLRLVPAHVDPTIAYHEQIQLVSGETTVDTWAVDLRGW
ncbi:MAG: alanine racemase [Myxococcota bacterium]|nr:alanine racemase [Myxococcota bacterium]